MGREGQTTTTDAKRAKKRAQWQRWFRSLSEEEKEHRRAYDRERQKQYRAKHKDTVIKREQAYRDINRDKVAQTSRRWKLKRKYGLTQEAYDAMRVAQGGKCAVCKVNDVAHVDHDHLSGRVRGLLCRECNIGLGNFRDSIEFLVNAAKYLEQHNAVA